VNDYDSFDNAVKIISRVIIVIYALLKIVFYMVFSVEFVMYRVISGALMIACVFLITGSEKLTRRYISILAPFSVAIIELITASQVNGDRLVYFVMIGCVLICLTYIDVFGLFIMIILTIAATALFIFVFNIPLMGAQFTFYDDLISFVGMILVFVIIFLLGGYSVSALHGFRKTGQTFDKILYNSSNLIVVINDEARVEYISKSLVRLLGIAKRDHALGLPFIDLFPSVRLKLLFSKFLRYEGAFEETIDVEAEGKLRWFILRSVPLGESKVARLFECVDITSLVESRQAAEAATRTKSEFLAAMSHEIRTPLNAIIGIAQIQLQKENLPDEYATALEKINVSGDSLLNIINDILDLSKIETGRMELYPGEYDVAKLINDAVQLNIVRIGSNPIEFTLDIDENLPSKLYGDELRLKQVLNNLLSNAIKYTKEGQVKLSVSHVSVGGDVILRFVIRDTGQGMKKEDREKLFSQYRRFNADVNRATEGTGLGLSITKRLIAMMEGTIAVESEYGKGSMFIVTAKQRAVECPPIGAEVADKLRNFTFTNDWQAVALEIKKEPMPYGSVLVVDDVDTNLYVAKGLLSPYKLKIETAESGFEAIEQIENGNVYDIIFMDHMMPKMDGIEATQILRERGYKGTIVALTANALVGSDKMFAQHGFDGFISKPIDIRRLNEVLNQFIRDRRRSK
jgi:signal transduction histidine kinase/ActR/RegA family two-component response regulator